MGQKQSKVVAQAAQLPPDSDMQFPSARILPGGYILRNKATGTCLRLVQFHPSTPEYNPGSNDVQKDDVVGWEQDSTSLDALEDEIWWIEWDAVHKGYIISNVGKGLVLDFRFPAVQLPIAAKKVAAAANLASVKGILCARARVRGLGSPKSSNRSSARSSIDFVTREEALTEEPPQMSVEDCIKKQRWKFKRGQPTSESFSIHNMYDPSIIIDLDWGKSENGAKVQLCPRTGVNHQQWSFIIPQLPGTMVPVGSWVFIRNKGTGAFLHHVDKNYAPAGIKLPKWEGICEKREYWGLHWCFVRVSKKVVTKEGVEVDVPNGEEGERWYIKNRLTGTLLEHVDGRRRGDSIFAENADTSGAHKRKEWKVQVVISKEGFAKDARVQGGHWAMINEDSGCVLDHYAGKSIQCYHPGWTNDSRQWKIMEAATPFTSHCSAVLSPLSTLPPLPALQPPLPADFDTTTLLPLLMPSGASFHSAEQATWPFPAPAPCSRDVLGHEERRFFELMSRIETQLVSKPWNPQKRILADIEEGWSSWAFGYAKGQMSNWNNLVNSEKVRGADVRERYVTCFGEAVVIVRDLVERFYIEAMERGVATHEGVASSSSSSPYNILSLEEKVGEKVGEKRVIALPTRVTYLVIMAACSLERVVGLRRVALGADWEEDIYGRTAGCDGERQREARVVNRWVLGQLEGALKGLEGVEEWCRGGVERKWFVQ